MGDSEEEQSDQICTGKWDSSYSKSNSVGIANQITNKILNTCAVFKVLEIGEGINDSNFPL